MKIVFVAGALVTAFAVAGCGSEVIESSSIEDGISEDAEAAGLVLDEVSCPEPEVESGATFECDVTVKGEESKFEVTQADDEGSLDYAESLNALLQQYGAGGKGRSGGASG